MKRALPAVAAGLAALCLVPAHAFAHVSITGGRPEPGGIIRKAPQQLVIRFNEPVDPRLAVVEVEDARGLRVDQGPVTATRGGIAIALRPGLRAGGYSVRYRVVSDEGHVIPGGYGFGIGASAVAPVVSIADSPSAGTAKPAGLGAAESAARGVRDGGIAVVAGVLAFLLLVWWKALGDAAGASQDWRRAGSGFAAAVRRLVAGAAVIGAIAAGSLVLLTAAGARGGSLSEALRPQVLDAVLGTRFGAANAAAVILLLLVAICAAFAGRLRIGATLAPLPPEADAAGRAPIAPPSAAASLTAALTAGMLIAVPVLAGHAPTRAVAGASIGAAGLHVLGAAVWIGGLAVLLSALPAALRELAPAERGALALATLKGFSKIAVAALVLLAAGGLLLALIDLGSIGQLLSTPFGRSVLIKSGLLLAVLGVAAGLRYEHLPRLESLVRGGGDPRPAEGGVRRAIALEALGLVAVLAVTGVLTGYPPPAGGPARPVPIRLSYEQARLAGSLTPAAKGANRLELVLARREVDRAFDDLAEVRVVAKGPNGAVVRTTVPGQRDGTYNIPLRLPASGEWRLSVTLFVDPYNVFTRDQVVRVH